MKKRLDQLVVERGLAPTLAKADALIMAREILVAGKPADKAGHPYPEEIEVSLVSTGAKYVSRGGIKLEGALEQFGISVQNLICLDVGSSTGGFADCLLQRGADHIFTIDVGRGQLDPKIRNHPQVTWRESFHARDLTPEILGKPVDLAVVDVSFISLRRVIPYILPCIKSGGLLLALIKPQFEVKAQDLAKGGILKDEDKRMQVIQEIIRWVSAELKFRNVRMTDSVLRGPKGNLEAFLCARTP